MKVWIYIVAILLAVISIFMFVNNYKLQGEPFVDFGNLGAWANKTNDFTKYQRTYFDTEDKAVPVGESVIIRGQGAIGNINDALQNPDLYNNGTVSPDMKKDFSTLFYRSPPLQQSIDSCKTIGSPLNIQRAPSDNLGCGWVYNNRDNEESVGSFGDSRGPSFPNETNGEWIWSKNLAIQKENIKRCRQIKTCEGISGLNTSNGVKCGFCQDSNMRKGIPVTNSGLALYPDADDATCSSGNVVMDSSFCSASASASTTQTVPPSSQCNSANWEDRLDTERGVTRKWNGVTNQWVDETACATSDSVNGRDSQVMGSSIGGGTLQSPCQPVNGKLTRECLKQQARSAGFQDSGRLITILNQSLPINTTEDLPNTADKMAYSALVAAGVPVLIDIFGRGTTTVDSVSATLNAIRNKSMESGNSRAKTAAIWFRTGTEFEVCAYENAQQGPFLLDCMQQEFRKAGCQASGAEYPNTRNQNNYNANTWGGLKTKFTEMYSAMSAFGNKSKKQDEAVKNCLGMQYFRVKPLVCDEFGIEYLVYQKAPTSTDASPEPKNFIGRIISKTGRLEYRTGSNYWDYDLPLGTLFNKIPNSLTQVRMVKVPTQNETLTSTMWKPQNLNAWLVQNVPLPLNKFTQRERWQDQVNGVYTLDLIKNQPTVLKLVSNNQVGSLIDQMTPETVKDYMLLQDSWKPVISLDFYKSSLADSNQIIDIRPPTFNISYREHLLPNSAKKRNGISLQSNNNSIQWKQGLHEDVLKSLTTSVYLQSGTAGNLVNLISFRRSENEFIEIAFKISTNGYSVQIIKRLGNMEPIRLESAQMLFATWNHIAIIFRESRIIVYVNGQASRSVNMSPLNRKLLADTVTMLSAPLNATVAWIHIYDYTLDNDEIERDMKFDNEEFVMERPSNLAVPQRMNCLNVEYGKVIDRSKGPVTVLRRFDAGNRPEPKVAKTTVRACCDACNETVGCKAFEFNPEQSGMCTLYSSATSLRPTNYQEHGAVAQGLVAYIKPSS